MNLFVLFEYEPKNIPVFLYFISKTGTLGHKILFPLLSSSIKYDTVKFVFVSILVKLKKIFNAFNSYSFSFFIIFTYILS